eukprot:5654284-Prymnesium_polylepis.1
MTDPKGLEFPWYPKPVADLASPEGINEETCLCLMLEGCAESVKAAAVAELTRLAEESKAADVELLFFTATSSVGAVPQVRKLAGVEAVSDQPQLLLIDIPDDGGFYVAEPAPLTYESAKAFLAAYKAGSLERKQLG